MVVELVGITAILAWNSRAAASKSPARVNRWAICEGSGLRLGSVCQLTTLKPTPDAAAIAKSATLARKTARRPAGVSFINSGENI